MNAPIRLKPLNQFLDVGPPLLWGCLEILHDFSSQLLLIYRS